MESGIEISLFLFPSIFLIKIGTTHPIFYGVIFHFMKSSFRTSIYNNTWVLNHLDKKLLRSYRFFAKSYRIIDLVHISYLSNVKCCYLVFPFICHLTPRRVKAEITINTLYLSAQVLEIFSCLGMQQFFACPYNEHNCYICKI